MKYYDLAFSLAILYFDLVLIPTFIYDILSSSQQKKPCWSSGITPGWTVLIV